MYKTKAIETVSRDELIKRLRTPSRYLTRVAYAPGEDDLNLECVALFKQITDDLDPLNPAGPGGDSEMMKELRELNRKMDALAVALEIVLTEAVQQAERDEAKAARKTR
jgi:hypothetical protein